MDLEKTTNLLIEKISSCKELNLHDQFNILRHAAQLLSLKDKSYSQNFILICLEFSKLFTGTHSILIALAREHGYFQYIKDEKLNFADTVACFSHEPLSLNNTSNSENKVVFHKEQYAIYEKLRTGSNVVLSAPTSFGKSKIIDAIIADVIYSKILIIVPTLALIDETRKRLNQLFAEKYFIVTQIQQHFENEDKIIFILTAERAIAMKDKLPKIEFFILDEFYKIGNSQNKNSSSNNREISINEIFYFLTEKHKAKFYLLGPNIKSIPKGASDHYKFDFIESDYKTVTANVISHQVKPKERIAKIIEICKNGSNQTIIYCPSKIKVYKTAEAVSQALDFFDSSNEVNLLADWLDREYHDDWLVSKALRKGIGIHIATLPRFLSQEIIRLFNNKSIRFLICTTTITEGVNTNAKTMIISESKVGSANMDLFTFNNIKGRAGRMFKHFVGEIHLLDKEPSGTLPEIEFQTYTQGDSVSETVLIQLDEDNLLPAAKERLESYYRQEELPISIIKSNHGVHPDLQIEIYNIIKSNLYKYNRFLNWHGIPTDSQLYETVGFLYDKLLKNNRELGVYSGKQLAFQLSSLSKKNPYQTRIKNLISKEKQGKHAAKDATDAIEKILTFERNCAGFHFPQMIMVLDRIQKYVFNKHNLKPGDYSLYAAKVESLFRPPHCVIFDEFGVPYSLSEKIKFSNEELNSLDLQLKYLRNTNPQKITTDLFEIDLLERVQSNLPKQ